MAMAMKLILDRIDVTPREYEFEAPPSWWLKRVEAARELEYEVKAPFHFVVEAYRAAGNEFCLQGIATGELELECGRCLTRYRHALREDFRLVLQDAAGRVPPDPEGVESLTRDGLCLLDELELGWYRGSEIVLDGFFGEVISDAIPIQFLCSEDCAGLCPICGARRADGDCGCALDESQEASGQGDAPERASPFAVLAKLRDELPGGDNGGKK